MPNKEQTRKSGRSIPNVVLADDAESESSTKFAQALARSVFGRGYIVVHEPIISEYAINPREVIRAEVCTINGRQVVSLSRWKLTPTGSKRTGCAFEFGAHRCKAVAGLLADIERELGGIANATT